MYIWSLAADRSALAATLIWRSAATISPGPTATMPSLCSPKKTGPVCRPDKVAHWFCTDEGAAQLQAEAPRLHTRTRPGAWQEWALATGLSLPDAPEQTCEHYDSSLQAAVAGLGVAIGPWHLVRDDLDNGVLCAPSGFVEDGSGYCLLSPRPLLAGSPQARLLAWLRTLA